jgi:hypothetical protein
VIAAQWTLDRFPGFGTVLYQPGFKDDDLPALTFAEGWHDLAIEVCAYLNRADLQN